MSINLHCLGAYRKKTISSAYNKTYNISSSFFVIFNIGNPNFCLITLKKIQLRRRQPTTQKLLNNYYYVFPKLLLGKLCTIVFPIRLYKCISVNCLFLSNLLCPLIFRSNTFLLFILGVTFRSKYCILFIKYTVFFLLTYVTYFAIV